MIRTHRATPFRRLTLRCAGVILLLSAPPASAQDTGSVSGTVVDSSSQVVPGATVTLTHEATANTRTTTSGPRGAFVFRALAPGSYTVKIELSGFRTLEQKQTFSKEGYDDD